jgi:TPR repeat protein
MLSLFTLMSLLTGLGFSSTPDPITLEEQCDQGNAESCGKLGGHYISGAGVRVDLAKGIELTQRGCAGKDTSSCTNLGALLLTGTGIDPDPIRASELFRQSCTAGSGEACHYLGGQYLLGIGVKTNPELARAHNLTACQRNVAAACGHLGGMVEHGFGYEPDLKMAAKMRGRACDGGDIYSCTKLGYIFEDGRGHPVDKKRAGELYLKACKGDESMGCFRLGELVRTGAIPDAHGNGAEPMYARSIELASKACQAGQAFDCLTVADALFATDQKSEASTLYRNAIGTLKSQCDRGDFTTCLELERLYLDGLGTDINAETAALFRAKACALGAKVACN